MRERALGVFVVLLVSPALADRTIAVDVTASSAAKGKDAWRAVDGETKTAWCEGKDDEGLDETIKLTFAEPLKVTRLDLYVGLHDAPVDYDENNRVSKVSVRTAAKIGDPMVVLSKGVPITSKYNTLVKLDLKTPRTIQVLELGLAGVTRGDDLKANQTCIADISLVAEKNQVVSFLYGVPPDAMSQLTAAVNVLRTAVAGCEEKVLAWAVKFPIEHRVEAEEDSRTIKHANVKSLVKACRKDAFPQIPVDEEPTLSASGLGRVSVEANGTGAFRYDMAWTDGGWKLARIESH
jgi:hypothetical protein